MYNFLLIGRAILMILFGLYSILLAYIGYNCWKKGNQKIKGNTKVSNMFISLGVIGLIIVLYSLYLIFKGP